MVTGRTLIHAIIGAVVGIVLSFIPLSTVIGGAAAGFLEGPDGRDGAVVGALAGLIAFLPFAVGAVALFAFFGFAIGVAAAPVEGVAFVVFALLVLGTFAALYTVGLSLVGGYLGSYLAREYPQKRANTRRTIGMEEPTPPNQEPSVPREGRPESVDDRYSAERSYTDPDEPFVDRTDSAAGRADTRDETDRVLEDDTRWYEQTETDGDEDT
ncbi:DUF5518 domain-containing protein [Natronobacterium texcoconense]|uniref:FoF1-type ATP synthase assembly protein I n=1 Tax=Natronobacterium texcoconense TaxID=1095778 RepID=A0A1H1HX71_NATTX|nr:DUF5518 domain-containing protein [Natronobacterium texcoconense]SDR30034.1 FoF1-type ATP synthase assembly protein I [Natronobacterium texcoconense]